MPMLSNCCGSRVDASVDSWVRAECGRRSNPHYTGSKFEPEFLQQVTDVLMGMLEVRDMVAAERDQTADLLHARV